MGDTSPCAVPTVANAHADGVCGVDADGVTAVSEILHGNACTVSCLDDFTANVDTTACSAGALAATITCTATTATTPDTTCDCSAAGRLLQSADVSVGDSDDDEDFALKSGCPLLGLILVA